MLEEVLKRNSDSVYRTAYLRVGNKHDAEDIMQDVFVRYIRKQPVFASAEHEKAWFIRCTVNLTKSFFTSARMRRNVPLDEDIPTEDSHEETGLIDTVMKLPGNMRTAIHLYYYENMSVKEVSEAMGKSESAVKSLLMRGRETLKRMLGEDYMD
ncbi:MAG: RNA polymerase sigma factor [Clostridia bacterium]|nr:RNA polymerase sigma factor [Clostridia bacterium]